MILTGIAVFTRLNLPRNLIKMLFLWEFFHGCDRDGALGELMPLFNLKKLRIFSKLPLL